MQAKKMYVVDIPYSDKFWCGENLVQLEQNAKNHRIKSAPNLIFPYCTILNPLQI